MKRYYWEVRARWPQTETSSEMTRTFTSSTLITWCVRTLPRSDHFTPGMPDFLRLDFFRPSRPRDCGVVTLSEDGLITSFEEKPSEPKSDLASAGIFLARQALFDWLPGAGFADLGKHVMPRLLGAMAGLHLEGYILDIGTPENYQKALKEWPAIADSIDANKVSGN